MRLLGILLVLFAGALTTVEAGANAQLTKSFRAFWWPAVVFGAVTFVVLLLAAVIAPHRSRARRAVAIPRWAWTGAPFGAP